MYRDLNPRAHQPLLSRQGWSRCAYIMLPLLFFMRLFAQPRRSKRLTLPCPSDRKGVTHEPALHMADAGRAVVRHNCTCSCILP